MVEFGVKTKPVLSRAKDKIINKIGVVFA